MDASTVRSITNPEFMTKIPNLMKSITRLTHSGRHLEAWSNQLKVMVHNLTGIPDYLNQPLQPTIDKKVDRLVFSMILWSIDKTLQIRVNINSTAYEAFCSLVQQLSAPPHQSISARPTDNTSTSKTCFLSLPNDILDQIIQLVRMEAVTEIETKTVQRWPRIIKLDSDNVAQYFGWFANYPDFIPAWVDPPSQNTTPILNSFQSLAAVSRRLHQLCLPWLWEKLVFPTSMPRFPATYIKDICPKYGHLVKSVKAELSMAWTQHAPRSRQEVTDNLILPDCDTDQLPLDYEGVQCGLSPENLIKIIVQCPNLRTLKLRMPEWACMSEDDDRALLELRILDLVTNFNQIRHLELQNVNEWELSESCVLKMVEQLPLLENFRCENLSRIFETTEALRWVQTLSQLKNLTKLALCDVCCVDSSWYIPHTWPQIITDLTLDNCYNLSIQEVHRLVHCIAPRVTDLAIKILPKKDSDWLTESQCDTFNLPRLKRLDFTDISNLQVIHTFHNCKKLQHLMYDYFPGHSWYRFHDLVLSSTWPELKHISIPTMGEFNYADCKLLKIHHSLQKYCRENSIMLEAEFI